MPAVGVKDLLRLLLRGSPAVGKRESSRAPSAVRISRSLSKMRPPREDDGGRGARVARQNRRTSSTDRRRIFASPTSCRSIQASRSRRSRPGWSASARTPHATSCEGAGTRSHGRAAQSLHGVDLALVVAPGAREGVGEGPERVRAVSLGRAQVQLAGTCSCQPRSRPLQKDGSAVLHLWATPATENGSPVPLSTRSRATYGLRSSWSPLLGSRALPKG